MSVLEVMGTVVHKGAQLRSGAQDLGQQQKPFHLGSERLPLTSDLSLVLTTGVPQGERGPAESFHHTSVSKKLWFRGRKFDPSWGEDAEAVRTESCREL